MQSKKDKLKSTISKLLITTASLVFVLGLCLNNVGLTPELEAFKLENKLATELNALDKRLSKVAVFNSSIPLRKSLGAVPEYVTVYRYVDDKLQDWLNQFDFPNDGYICMGEKSSSEFNLAKLNSDEDFSLGNTLSENSDFDLVNYGKKWYLAKLIVKDNVKLVYGIEVASITPSSSDYGELSFRTAKYLSLDSNFEIRPLNNSTGVDVYFRDKAIFKLLCREIGKNIFVPFDYATIALAFILYIAFSLVYLSRNENKQFWKLFILIFLLSFFTLAMYLWSRNFQSEFKLFSPGLYAGGQLFSSLGIILLINLYIFVLSLYLYLMRIKFIYFAFRSSAGRVFSLSLGLIAVILIVIYFFLAFRSVILDSTISLKLYNFSQLDIYSFVVYLSFIVLISSIPLILHTLSSIAKSKISFLSLDFFSSYSRAVFAVVISIVLLVLSIIYGGNKERAKVSLWANILSMDRDINLESRLLSLENDIINDTLIYSLLHYPNADILITNAIKSNIHYQKLPDSYSLELNLIKGKNIEHKQYLSFDKKLSSGEPVSENSRFVYTGKKDKVDYMACFVFYDKRADGVVRMLLSLEQKAVKRDWSEYEQGLLPSFYSYARYLSGRLYKSKGEYLYPTKYKPNKNTYVNDSNKGVRDFFSFQHNCNNFVKDNCNAFYFNNFKHYVVKINEEESILISRKKTIVLNYFLVLFLLISFSFIIISSIAYFRKKVIVEKNYYKSRIYFILVFILIATTILMSAVSMIFLYKKNNASIKSLSLKKINAIRDIVEHEFHESDYKDLMEKDKILALLDKVAEIEKSELLLYDTLGKLYLSTNQNILDRMLLPARIEREAFEDICHKYRKYHFSPKSVGGNEYFALYAPILNSSGELIAIVATPYINKNHTFKMEVGVYFMYILSIIIILMFSAIIFGSKFIDNMFKPLMMMIRKMNSAELGNMEYIIYEIDDEISSLVRAYNLMLHDLHESTKQLAVAEREKAWSEMARQVAHEVKTPLTPMKLQIQRLIRLKKQNVPQWNQIFEEVSKNILDNIDRLSDTSNEFLTFSKLYTQEATLINLDLLLKEEIAMFDVKPNIIFEYIGFENAYVYAPKPQLMRVFVNLIVNSIQAIEISQEEESSLSLENDLTKKSKGEGVPKGKIRVSLLNNSIDDDYYDIVIEDNGPGVKEENYFKLFKPNFTTKNGGTGLGLAICFSILEKCSGEIKYSKSFALKGACFTVKLPKTNTTLL